MAAPIKGVEKDFFLKDLFDERMPLVYLRNHIEYTLELERPVKNDMYLKSDKAITGLWPRKKINLVFDFRGVLIACPVEVISCKDNHIVTKTPERIYKNLERSFVRVPCPADLKVCFTSREECYDLPYPKITGSEETIISEEVMKDTDFKDLNGLIAQMAAWVKGFTDGYRLILFKDVKPSTREERLLAETGKCLYLPSTAGEFPTDDPFPQKRIVTLDLFYQFLERFGVEQKALDAAVSKYLRIKVKAGIYAEVYIPILFKGYVVGYIHSWCGKPDKQPFGQEAMETFFQFAGLLAYSLKESGAFESGRLENKPFEERIIDVSVSGILFACSPDAPAAALKPGSELAVALTSPEKTVECSAKIVRQYKDAVMLYNGCRFLDMEPGEMRNFFEFLYGRPFDAAPSDMSFFTGKV